MKYWPSLLLIALFALIVGLSIEGSIAPGQPSTDRIDLRGWAFHEIKSLHMHFLLPSRYREKNWTVTIGQGVAATYQAPGFDRVEFETEIGSHPLNEDLALQRQLDYRNYKKWNQKIGGRPAIVQSYQGGGVIFDRGQQLSPYSVTAMFQLEHGRNLRILSMGATSKAQDEIIAMLGTIKFDE